MLMQSFKMAMDSILANKMRSFLTMLGIIIGVIALVVLVSMVTSASNSIEEEVNAMGTDTLSVTIVGGNENPLTRSEVLELQDSGALSYTAAVTQTMSKINNSEDTFNITGITPSYFNIEGLKLEAGRGIKTSDVDNGLYVAVFSAEAADDVFHTTDIVGEHARISGREFTVVGVLEASESLMAQFLGNTVYIPYTTAARMSGGSESVQSIVAAAAPGVDIDQAQVEMDRYLEERFRGDKDSYTIFSSSIIADAMDNITGMLSLVLGGIAAISLLVGGIGIMNIMLVSVTERTPEIGIRKAVGATTKDILVQFLIEALVLSLFGCLIGVLCSWGIISLATYVSLSTGHQMVFIMSGGVVVVSVIFACLIGVVFGIYPARKAANMKPIDALHYTS